MIINIIQWKEYKENADQKPVPIPRSSTTINTTTGYDCITIKAKRNPKKGTQKKAQKKAQKEIPEEIPKESLKERKISNNSIYLKSN